MLEMVTICIQASGELVYQRIGNFTAKMRSNSGPFIFNDDRLQIFNGFWFVVESQKEVKRT